MKIIRFFTLVFLTASAATAGCKSGSEIKKEVTRPSVGTGSGSAAEQLVSIHQAALDGDLSQVSMLLERGCKPDTLDTDGRTALMYAAYNGHTAVIQKLISSGASVNLSDANGRTALMMASSGPFTDVVKLLLASQADPNLTDKEEHFSALMYAASEGQMEVVRLLLVHNADPFLKDVDGDDAITFARSNNHREIAGLLQSYKDKFGKK